MIIPGIESCRQAQSRRFRREKRDLLKSLAQFDTEKLHRLNEDEQYFLGSSSGDELRMLSNYDFEPGAETSRKVGKDLNEVESDIDQGSECFFEHLLDKKLTSDEKRTNNESCDDDVGM